VFYYGLFRLYYKLYYNYPDKGDASDVLWVDINDDVKIKSGETVIFWINKYIKGLEDLKTETF